MCEYLFEHRGLSVFRFFWYLGVRYSDPHFFKVELSLNVPVELIGGRREPKSPSSLPVASPTRAATTSETGPHLRAETNAV